METPHTLAPFDWGPPISCYSDADAIEDGVLVDIAPLGVRFEGSPLTRATASAWAQQERSTPEATSEGIRELLAGAQDAGGDLFIVPTTPPLWVAVNEGGGWTLMRPEDY